MKFPLVRRKANPEDLPGFVPKPNPGFSATPSAAAAIEGGTANFTNLLGVESRGIIREAYVQAQSERPGWLYKSQPSVRTVVDLLKSEIKSIPIQLFERTGDGEAKEAYDHPAAALVRKPNEYTPASTFIEQIVGDLLIYSNAYVVKLNAGGKRRLVYVPAHRMAMIGPSLLTVDYYYVQNPDGSKSPIPPENVIHIHDFDPTDPRRGYSRLDTLRLSLTEERVLATAQIELAKEGFSLASGWISRPVEAPDMTPEGRERFEEEYAAQIKKEKPPILPDGMKFEQSNLTPEKAQLLESRKNVLGTVAGVYGVPKGLVGLEGGSLADEMTFLYRDVLPPICETVEGFLNLDLLGAEYGADESYYFKFNLDAKMRGDIENKLASLNSASGGPFITANEARAMLDLPPIEGGEVLTAYPGTVKAEPDNPDAKPAPNVMPPQDPQGDPQDGSHRDGTRDDESKAAEPETRDRSASAKAANMARSKAQENRRNDYAEDLAGVLSKHFQRQLGALSKKDAEDERADSDRWNDDLRADLLPVYQRQVKHEGDIAGAYMGLSAFDMGQVKHYLEKKADNTARSINKATQDALEVPDAEAADVLAVAKHERAKNLGMEFATQLSGFAHREAGRQTPDSQHRLKTWIVTSSHSRHPQMNGETVPIFTPFSNGLEMPGDPAGNAHDTAHCECLMSVA